MGRARAVFKQLRHGKRCASQCASAFEMRKPDPNPTSFPLRLGFHLLSVNICLVAECAIFKGALVSRGGNTPICEAAIIALRGSELPQGMSDDPSTGANRAKFPASSVRRARAFCVRSSRDCGRAGRGFGAYAISAIRRGLPRKPLPRKKFRPIYARWRAVTLSCMSALAGPRQLERGRVPPAARVAGGWHPC